MEVTDNGPGVQPKDLDKLFEPFSMIEETKSMNPTGTGLGLNICRNICQHLGGEINYVQLPNKGATFKFFLNLLPDLKS